jgi:hypothetical protein
MKKNKLWKLLIVSICLFLAVTLMLPTSALAQGIIVGETVEAGEVLDQNAVLYGPAVVMDGVINGDMLAVGDKITINGEVDGSLVIIGKTVTLNSPVGGSVYVAAISLKLGPQATIGRDVFFIGGRLETNETSSINRDLNVIGLEATLSGNTGRDVNALVGPLNLIQAIYNYMISKGWLPPSLQLNSTFQDGSNKLAVPVMAFGLPSVENRILFSSAPVGRLALEGGPGLQASEQGGTIDVEQLKSWAVPTLRNLAALLILGLLVLWLVPAQLNWAGEKVRTNPWRALLNGLLVFVFGWLSVLLLFVLILALAFFFFWASLPNLAFLTGTLGLGVLGVAVSIFWLSINYFSKIIVAFLFGRLLFKRFIPKYAHSRIWPFLTGVILYVLLASVPYLGWLVAVIVTFFGLGALWMVSNPRKMPESQTTAQPQVVEDNPDTSIISEG